ncbi:NUDIX domain-containing protein [Halomarina salina]|uniref:NUDIX domain-containing protein n=1 Tax=Halomarina salina TaxID=1872699 RepID=A0ABD5RIL0_9EURY|nr:NUDIX domain-containing protein [Halomarina salina]
MSRGETYDRVRSILSSLRGTYGHCPVRQTTISVPTTTYDRLRGLAERSVVDVGVRVNNARGESLVVRNEGGWTDPCGHVEDGESIEAGACRVFHETADFTCDIEGLLGITILCLTDASDAARAPIYRLGALFDGGRTEGTGCEECQWRPVKSGPFVGAY